MGTEAGERAEEEGLSLSPRFHAAIMRETQVRRAICYIDRSNCFKMGIQNTNIYHRYEKKDKVHDDEVKEQLSFITIS